MAGVIDDVELLADQVSDPLQGPAVVWMTVGAGTLLEQAQQSPTFGLVQLAWPARDGLGRQRLRPPGFRRLRPPADRGNRDTKPPSDLFHAQATCQ